MYHINGTPKFIFNEKKKFFCFGGKQPSAPQIQSAPAPAPAPTVIEPTEVAAVSQDERRKKLQKMRFGLASTIATGPKGLVANNTSLASPEMQGKTKLGA